MNIGDYVSISPEVVLPEGQHWNEIMQRLVKNSAIGIVTKVWGTSAYLFRVGFLVEGAPINFLFGREELEYAPIDLLSIIEAYKTIAHRY